MIKRILLGLLAVGLVSESAFADVVIRNGSDYEITQVYVSPQSVKSWGKDHLGDKILGKGNKLTLTGVDPGTWDFQIVFREVGGKEEWKCVIPGIELSDAGDDSTFETETLNKCNQNTENAAEEEESEE
jgi:hypothetical protein